MIASHIKALPDVRFEGWRAPAIVWSATLIALTAIRVAIAACASRGNGAWLVPMALESLFFVPPLLLAVLGTRSVEALPILGRVRVLELASHLRHHRGRRGER